VPEAIRAAGNRFWSAGKCGKRGGPPAPPLPSPVTTASLSTFPPCSYHSLLVRCSEPAAHEERSGFTGAQGPGASRKTVKTCSRILKLCHFYHGRDDRGFSPQKNDRGLINSVDGEIKPQKLEKDDRSISASSSSARGSETEKCSERRTLQQHKATPFSCSFLAGLFSADRLVR
jgi:hypothetical protein